MSAASIWRPTPSNASAPPALAPFPGRPAATAVYSLAHVAARLLRCQRAAFVVVEAGREPVVAEAFGLPRGFSAGACQADETALARCVAASGRVEIANAPFDLGRRCKLRGPYASLVSLAVPLRLPDGAVEVATVVDRENGALFGPEDAVLLGQIAALHASVDDEECREELESLRGEVDRIRATVIQSKEEEQRRLARELHDEVGHALAGAILKLNTVGRTLIGDGPLPQALEEICDLLTDCADRLHDLAFNLRPRLLEDLGLAPALRSLVRRIRTGSEVRAEVRLQGEPRRLHEETELAAFRIVQEATTNALKHAAPSSIEIDVAFRERGVELTVIDDGRGFDPNRIVHDGVRDHHGLAGMRERAELVGGFLGIESRPGDGTTVRAWLPDAGQR